MVSKDLYIFKNSKSYILNDYNGYICLKFNVNIAIKHIYYFIYYC